MAASSLMTQTLRDPRLGAYDQDIWVLSTQLSSKARSYLEAEGICAHVSPMTWADEKMKWRQLFPGKPDAEALAAFHAYRNKRMSKLIYLEWHALHGQDYHAVAICDNDLYFQSDVSGLFEQAANGCINYAAEANPIYPGTSLWKKDLRYRQLVGDWEFNGGLHEVNIGFITAQPNLMKGLFEEIQTRFTKLPPSLIRDHNWHDQDLARVIRAAQPELFREFPEDSILHLCGGGMALVEERQPGHFVNRLTGNAPCVVHFGGGTWKEFRSVAPSFQAAPQDVFDNACRTSSQALRLAISKVDYNSGSGLLRAHGWFVAPAETPPTLVVSITNAGVIGIPVLGPARPDVAAIHPGSGSWDFVARLPKVSEGETLEVTLISNSSLQRAQKPVFQ
ncbi:hypothetical protein RA26_13055 [Leisingera sp. ANG-M7]|nr:hypothetical protein RA26_13055 [Leisingera sp. ANG-M7]